MKEQIQSLIEQGKIKEAIELGIESNEQCILLKARHNNLEKSFYLGLITLNGFKRDEAVILNALIDLL